MSLCIVIKALFQDYDKIRLENLAPIISLLYNKKEGRVASTSLLIILVS